MRLLKTHPILGLVNSYMVDSPQPANISYMWNFGSLLGACLIIQIATGVTLAMHYTPSVDLAFISVEHIMRDVNYGWLIRYLHANVASFFFIFVYAHIGRALYYGSYKAPRTLPWSIGVIMLILMMAIAFLGKQNSQTWFELIQYNTIAYLSISPRCAAHIARLEIKPVAVFENLQAKHSIYAALKSYAGVYIILNLLNGDCYVGSSINGNMGNRFHRHLFALSGNKHVAAAVIKYGLENFAFIVVETLQGYINNEILLPLETSYISKLLPCYNIALVAGNTLGIKHTEASKQKMRVNYSSERRKQIGALNRGKTLPSKTRALLQKAALARPPMSNETRAKISANSRVANLYSVARLDEKPLLDGTLEIKVRTINNVARLLFCNEKTVRRAIKTNGIVKNEYKITVLGKAITL